MTIRFIVPLLLVNLVVPLTARAEPKAKPKDGNKTQVQIGVCTTIKGNALEQARDVGFDFAEIKAVEVAAMDDAEFAAAEAKVAALGMPIVSAILFLPPDLKVVGPTVDVAAQNAYLDRALPRLAKLGLRMVVFGSGRSRAVPEGFDRKQAMLQLIEFGRRAATRARAHGLLIVVESLQTKETNVINTTAEAIALVKAVRHPNFKMLVDHYHMSLMKEDPAVILKATRSQVVHAQIANPEGRTFPKSDAESDYGSFFSGLAQIGYGGRISIEGQSENFVNDSRDALAYLREATRPLSKKKRPRKPH